MKREAFRHPKTLDLAARLSLPHPYAFAHVCYLFNAAADIAAQGNIGKWPNGVIARSGEWTGDPDTFVQALIDSGWLDRHRDPHTRLLIHDWPEHAERFVKAKLARERVWFHWAYYAGGARQWDAPDGLELVIPDEYSTTSTTTSPTVEPTVDGSPPRDPTQPNPTKPIPTQPAACAAKRARKKSISVDGFDRWYQAYPRRIAREKASAAYGRAVLSIQAARCCTGPVAEAWLLERTKAYAASPAGKASDQPGDLRYVPHPASWLNAGRYADDPAEWQRGRSTTQEPESEYPDYRSQAAR